MVTPETLFTGKNCIYFKEIDSTNINAADLIAKTSPPEGTCVITDFQTAGNGQIGRFWHSDAGKNLLISYIFYPNALKVKEQFLLNIISSLAVYDVVSFFVKNVKIKWPNDIYVNNKKIAGILVQNTLRNDNIKSTVIGMGLNINETSFPSDIPNPTSLTIETNASHSIEDVFCRLSTRLEYYYLKLKSGKTSELKATYQEALFRRDDEAHFRDGNDVVFKGTIKGVNDDGKILIMMDDGSIHAFGFREISFLIYTDENLFCK
ncbi:MAG: biotin--[acetyl-CoA-carboxylase] ligase [Saprospiraceae bacterium]|nr:biotin--[acetyl-CoA-carboxylase] ligase [Saprospiraceae bacterium]